MTAIIFVQILVPALDSDMPWSVFLCRHRDPEPDEGEGSLYLLLPLLLFRIYVVHRIAKPSTLPAHFLHPRRHALDGICYASHGTHISMTGCDVRLA
jgi:hypothetical protein